MKTSIANAVSRVKPTDPKDFKVLHEACSALEQADHNMRRLYHLYHNERIRVPPDLAKDVIDWFKEYSASK